MRNFLVIRKYCPYCTVWKFIKVLTRLNVDLLYHDSGDLRIKSMHKQLGRITFEKIPLGVINNKLISSSRDFNHMLAIFKRE